MSIAWQYVDDDTTKYSVGHLEKDHAKILLSPSKKKK